MSNIFKVTKGKETVALFASEDLVLLRQALYLKKQDIVGMIELMTDTDDYVKQLKHVAALTRTLKNIEEKANV